MSGHDSHELNEEKHEGPNASSGFEKVMESEKKIISKRDKARRAGIALSGGGMRSAMVAQGVLQVFARHQCLEQFAYMSSVSGGGYAAAGLLAAGSQVSLETASFQAPGYSKPGLLIAALVEALFRVLAIVALALLVYECFPSLGKEGNLADRFDGVILGAITVVLGLVAGVLVEAEKRFWKRLHIVSFFFFSLFSLLMLFRMLGTVLSVISATFLFAAAVRYLRTMPHREYDLRAMRNWPRVVIFSLLVAMAYLYVPRLLAYFGSKAFMTGLIIMYALIIVHHFCYRRLDVQRAFREPISSYYRYHLTKRFIKKDKRIVESGGADLPFPIFNVTANNGADRFPFELSPLFTGSSTIGFIETNRLPSALSLADAMAISGGAVDVVYHDWNVRTWISVLVAGTGSWLAHTTTRLNAWNHVSNALKVIANAPSPSYLRVSDGGFTDNLGITALMRRQLGLIVCIDAAYDPEFEFGDLRKVCNYCALHGIGDIDIAPLLAFSHELRFAQKRTRHLSLAVTYPGTGKTAVLILVKLAARDGSDSKNRYQDFPHLPTADQQLSETELSDLFSTGNALATECLDLVVNNLSLQPLEAQSLEPVPAATP